MSDNIEEGTKSATPKSGGKIGDVEGEVECRHGFDDVALPLREHGRLLLGEEDDKKETENSENIRLRQRKRCISVLCVFWRHSWRSQDFVCGVHFSSPKKLTTFFSRRFQNAR